MHERLREEAAGDRGGVLDEILRGAHGNDFTTARARAGTEIDDVIGAADRVLVVLDDQQRITAGSQRLERFEEDLVVARVQADGRLVEDVAHALEIAAELRGEPDALRFAARERRR